MAVGSKNELIRPLQVLFLVLLGVHTPSLSDEPKSKSDRVASLAADNPTMNRLYRITCLPVASYEYYSKSVTKVKMLL